MKRLLFLVMLVVMAGCGGGGGGATGTGGSGSGPGADSGDVTISGKVADTTFVAVDAANSTVVARQAAATQTDGSKTFSIKVQSGKQYKFYLVENEGTSDERVFPLYIGSSNRFSLSAGTCDLGFVSTAGGTAVPANTPTQFAGAGEDKTVPAGVVTNQSSVYSQSDLAGTWYIFGFNVTDREWSRATYIITTTGAASTTNLITSNNPSPQTRNHTLTISPSGVVSTASGPFEKAVMTKSKDLVVGVGNDNDGQSRSMVIAVKAGTGFSQSDMIGAWQMHGLTVSDTQRGWIRGDASFAANGTSTLSNFRSSNPNLTSFGRGIPVTIDSTGLIAGGGGAMTKDKNLGVLTTINEDGSVSLALLVRSGGTTFSQADLKGTWRSNHINIGTSNNFWVSSQALIDATGIVSSFGVVTNGIAEPDNTSTAPVVLNAEGKLSGDVPPNQLEGIMTPNKKIAVYTKTNNTGNADYSRLGIVLK